MEEYTWTSRRRRYNTYEKEIRDSDVVLDKATQTEKFTISKRNLYVKCALVLAVLMVTVLFYRSDFNKILDVNYKVTPLNVPKVVEQNSSSPSVNPDLFWGTYRANLYFGLKTRSPTSPVFGLMWYEQYPDREQQVYPNIRHWCAESDNIKYGWIRHDGVNFGIHRIIESNFAFNTSFVKKPGGLHGGDWTVRISGEPKNNRNPSTVSFLMYIALDGQGELKSHINTNKIEYIEGQTDELDKFRITFSKIKKSDSYKHNYLISEVTNLVELQSTVKGNLVIDRLPYKGKIVVLKNKELYEDLPNFVVHQVTVELPFELDVIYESGSFRFYNERLEGDAYTEELSKYTKGFESKFTETFDLHSQNYKSDVINFAKEILSNMLGTISYFHGISLVKSEHDTEAVEYWPATLYTSIPSRSFFPRGFLWNVGFDCQLIFLWNKKISKEIISHWLELINMEGWIPREQILGVEAQARVPKEFMVQENHIANPPSLFLTIKNFLDDESYGTTVFLEKIYPRLESWFNWLHNSQKADRPTTYYWRGRNSTTDKELIPKTPASGLDDYPRASHPSPDERHLDIRCWMALASEVLANIGQRLGKNNNRYKLISQQLFDNNFLEKYHWNQEQYSFNDFGLHTNAVELNHINWTRIVYRDPKLKFLESFGYVSLYPLMLGILEPDSSQLSKILSDITKEELLWTDYGLRSLAKNSPFYQVWNTKDDPPYWRGSIWINLNYLTLSGLHHYANIPGLHKKMARDVYHQLRANLVNNMVKQYRATGFVFEYYDDTTGVGKGIHPYSSWSSLVVNIMAEKY